jgi:hypothetical protein
MLLLLLLLFVVSVRLTPRLTSSPVRRLGVRDSIQKTVSDSHDLKILRQAGKLCRLHLFFECFHVAHFYRFFFLPTTKFALKPEIDATHDEGSHSLRRYVYDIISDSIPTEEN